MTVRILVERTFQIAGRGPVVAGLLQEGEVSSGDSLVVRETGATVQVRGLEPHVRQPEEGRRVGLLVRPEDAPLVTPGSTLVSPAAG
jgi:selenocysteine-specific translation elongation factor